MTKILAIHRGYIIEMLVILFVLLLEVVWSYCPHGCGCDNVNLSVSCLYTDMEVRYGLLKSTFLFFRKDLTIAHSLLERRKKD